MFNVSLEMPAVSCSVVTTSDRGMSPEEVAKLCVDKLISISDDSHPAVKAQAHAFKSKALALITHYIKTGVQQDRATLCAELRKAGQHEIADQLRRM